MVNNLNPILYDWLSEIHQGSKVSQVFPSTLDLSIYSTADLQAHIVLQRIVSL